MSEVKEERVEEVSLTEGKSLYALGKRIRVAEEEMKYT